MNIKRPNKNPYIVSQKVLVVGAGPVGLRLAIELKMGGHDVVLFEKRREDMKNAKLGFTNRINRPHNWPFLKQDLAKLNGKDLLTPKQAYPVFTEPHTSSIGVSECQMLLLKNALMLGVDVRLGAEFCDAEVKPAKTGVLPRWKITVKYDTQAATKFGKEAGTEIVEEFDCLVGCDGARSKVRESCAEYFGGVEKRKFMESVGIVANLQKLPRKRLEELGFGQELNDMNRSKMTFRDMFEKIQKDADIDLDTVIYYRAANHNYCIFTPTKKNLEKHGICGNLYHFAEGRDKAATEAITKEKEKLKEYTLKIIKSVGIPYDSSLPNDGFMAAPNDCMAFDFSECWNTKRGTAFELNGPDEEVDEDMEEILHPLVALCGDALFEPFWPMGLGLKRGWQALMDVAYTIDNLHCTTLFKNPVPGQPLAGYEPNKDAEKLDYAEHQEKLKAQVEQLFDYCKRVCMTEPAAAGEYPDTHIITKQLKKYVNKDAEAIPYMIELDPWTRYAPLFDEASKKLQYQGWTGATRTADGGAATGDGKEIVLHPLVEQVKFRAEAQWPDKYKGKPMYTWGGKLAPNDHAQEFAKTDK